MRVQKNCLCCGKQMICSTKRHYCRRRCKQKAYRDRLKKLFEGNKKNKTAVKWLIKNLKINVDTEYFEQAKYIEKDNIKDTAISCFIEGFSAAQNIYIKSQISSIELNEYGENYCKKYDF